MRLKHKSFLVISLLLLVQHLQAQICTGSLGDPIVNITFGAGANPGPRLSSTATGYQYQANDCPQDGIYSIRNASVSCHNNTWHTITDHTGDPNGYFMLVNASMFPGAFYVDTVRGLCGNTTYEFAAWVMNILKPNACGTNGIKPDLTFIIEDVNGTVLQRYNSNTIPETSSPQWKQFGFFFKTAPSASEVVLRIINNSTGGCGNDLALDDITFRPCGPQISSAIVGTAQRLVTFCAGSSQTYLFSANISVGFNNPVVQWQQNYNNGAWTDISGANTYTYTKTFGSSDAAGTYAFRLSAAESGNLGVTNCRISSLPLTVIAAGPAKPTITATTPVCAGGILNVTSSVIGNWTGPNGFTANTSSFGFSNVQTLRSGRYYLTTSSSGCSRTDSIDVVVHTKPVIGISQSTFSLCGGDTAVVIITGADGYQFSPNSHMLSFASGYKLFPPDSMRYKVVGSNVSGCKDSSFIDVYVSALPEANAGADRSITEGTTIQLNGTAKGDSISYYWRPDYEITNTQALQPYVKPLQDTSYILHVSSNVQCGYDEDTVRIKVFKKLQVPNAFSPNGDGINDTWRIGGIESYPASEVMVFNRYGQVVFRTTNFNEWNGKTNGKNLPAGTYYYIINVHSGLPVASGWLYLFY